MRNISTMLLLCLLVQCRNPFVPPTGEPIQFPVTGQRSTPQGLLDQLIESYELMRIDLFKDLLPTDGSYRFFVAPDFLTEYQLRSEQLSEVRDARLQFIGKSDYWYYWTQKEEVERHTLLFSRVTNIKFDIKPGLGTVREFVDGGDSLAELLISGGHFTISIVSPDTTNNYPVDVGKQVFLIQKDQNHRWVIRKWYDFSGTGG